MKVKSAAADPIPESGAAAAVVEDVIPSSMVVKRPTNAVSTSVMSGSMSKAPAAGMAKSKIFCLVVIVDGGVGLLALSYLELLLWPNNDAVSSDWFCSFFKAS